MQEIDEDTVLQSHIILDSSGAKSAGDINVPLTNGTLDESRILGNLGDLIIGNN